MTGSSSREASVRRAEVDSDERVEVILASTALVAVIALFLRSVLNFQKLLKACDIFIAPNKYIYVCIAIQEGFPF